MAFYEEKISEFIRKSASEFLAREAGRNSLITVTHVTMGDNAQYATIYVSVLPESAEKSALDFLKRKRSEFKHYVKNHSRIGHIPFFDFEIDIGAKNSNRINELSQTEL